MLVQSPQLTKLLWTVLGLKSEIRAFDLISTLKKKVKGQARNELSNILQNLRKPGKSHTHTPTVKQTVSFAGKEGNSFGR